MKSQAGRKTSKQIIVHGYNDILDYTLRFLKDDYTELWVISAKVKELNPEFSVTEILDATKIIVTDLVINHNAILVDTHTEKPIIKQPSETIEILNRHLTNLNKVPNIGDGLWLTKDPKCN